jgi:hypothetical protein
MKFHVFKGVARLCASRKWTSEMERGTEAFQILMGRSAFYQVGYCLGCRNMDSNRH